MPDSDSDTDSGGDNDSKNSAGSLIRGGQNTHLQPTVRKSGAPQTTRGLPSWLTAPCSTKKLKRNKLQASRLPSSSESLEDGSPQEPLRKNVNSSLRSTVYCMSPAELYETAVLILQEKAKAEDSNQDTQKDAPSSSKGGKTSPHEGSTPQGSMPQGSIAVKSPPHQRSTPQMSTAKRSTPQESTPQGSTPKTTMSDQLDETTRTGGAKLLDDIFFSPSSRVKPPPRKIKAPQQNQKSLRSPSIQSQCIAPDTVSTVPETAGFTAASIGGKDSTTGLLGESLLEHKPEGTRENRGPDLSFLDDIF
ncbi:uncharacterized protein [Asterias amurensis]|uniref:uncharacterized protein isoform X2 n=1 Tax=Asterias amurensis TaxID=7602 RepID=UPI003AB6240F